jgi:hypothetical protein
MQDVGTINALYNHWMLGEAIKRERPPHWSIVRDILRWVELFCEVEHLKAN